MAPSFEERRDEIHEAILRGDVGCPFARDGAAKGVIEYCRAPRNIDPQKIPMAYVNAITEFSRSRTASVLIALPDADSPTTPEDCDAYAKLLFPETVSSMQFATHQILDHIFAEEADPEPELYELMEMNAHAARPRVFDFWQRNDNLLRETPAGGSAAAYLLRRHTQSLEQMFTFTMDPSYTSMRSLRHPRWSPHFALIINYRDDLQGLGKTAPSLYQSTKHWMDAAVGYDYVQGYRIGQTPNRVDPVKASWKPQD